MKVKQSTPKAAEVTVRLTVDEAMALYRIVGGEVPVEDTLIDTVRNELAMELQENLGV